MVGLPGGVSLAEGTATVHSSVHQRGRQVPPRVDITSGCLEARPRGLAEPNGRDKAIRQGMPFGARLGNNSMSHPYVAPSASVAAQAPLAKRRKVLAATIVDISVIPSRKAAVPLQVTASACLVGPRLDQPSFAMRRWPSAASGGNGNVGGTDAGGGAVGGG